MNEKDYFEEGRQAYRDGLELADCPYDGDSLEDHEASVEWEAGFMEAEEEG